MPESQGETVPPPTEMSTPASATSGLDFLTGSGQGKTDTGQKSTDSKYEPLCFIMHMTSAHLTQVFPRHRRAGPSGSLGILKGQKVTRTTTALATGCSGTRTQ